jgi:energy-coupling factor transporter ATP-binding protein EcfA2
MSTESSVSHSPLHISRVGIDRLDGISDRFELKTLCPGINLIFGPNACGKSRTATALQALIWPDTVPARAELSGHLATKNDAWLVTCGSQGRAYERNGSIVEPPNLSGIPSLQRDRYLLSLHDLLSSESQDLANIIQRESAGGYDINLAREKSGIGGTPPRAQSAKAKSAYQRARAQTKTFRDADLRLQAEERRLLALRQQLDDAVAAAQMEQLLTAALEYVAAKERLRESVESRAAFPDPIGQMSGDEFTRTERIRSKVDELSTKRRDAERAISSAISRLDKTGYGSQIPPEETLPALRARLGLLVERQAALRNAEDSVLTQRTLSMKARERLGATIDDTQIMALDESGIRKLAELKREFESVRLTAETQAELQSWIGPLQPVPDLAPLRRGIELLSSRLRTPGKESAHPPSGTLKVTLLLAAMVIVIEAIVLAATTSPLFAAMVALAIPVIAVAFRQVQPEARHLASELEREYQALGLEQVSDTSSNSLIADLDRLRERLAEAEVDHAKAGRWANLANRRQEAEEKSGALVERIHQVVDELGVAIAEDPDSVRLIADALEKWRHSTDERLKAESIVISAREKISQSLGQMNATFSLYGIDDAIDHLEASAKIDELERRIVEAKIARSEVQKYEDIIESRIDPEMRTQQQEIESLLSSLGLLPGDHSTLQDLCERVPACKDAQRKVEQNEVLAKSMLARLDGVLELSACARPELESRLAEARHLSGSQTELQATIIRIEQSVNTAKTSSNLEAAVADEAVAFEALSQSRARDWEKVAGWNLSEFVQSQSRDKSRPPVFRKARDLFTDFTAGSFRLEIDEGVKPSFRAVETSSGRGVGLDQLSSGTRVQLLMAVRLAFIEEMESGHQLPLILDEILGNTDDLRASAIIDATIEICRLGRQVIYFTAQHD